MMWALQELIVRHSSVDPEEVYMCIYIRGSCIKMHTLLNNVAISKYGLGSLYAKHSQCFMGVIILLWSAPLL